MKATSKLMKSNEMKTRTKIRTKKMKMGTELMATKKMKNEDRNN